MFIVHLVWYIEPGVQGPKAGIHSLHHDTSREEAEEFAECQVICLHQHIAARKGAAASVEVFDCLSKSLY